MKTPHQRINNVIGQLEAVKRMMDSKDDCFEILTQLKAAKAGVNTLMHNMIEDNFSECIQACGAAADRNRLKKLMKEMVK